MHKYFFLIFAAVLALGACGCGGGSTGSTPTTVVLTPTTLSLVPGEVATLSPVAENAAGTVFSAQTFTFTTADSGCATHTAPCNVDVSTSGMVCAGNWDNESTPSFCCPGTWQDNVTQCLQPTQPVSLTSTVITGTDTIPHVSASGTATVFVHAPVASIAITSPSPGCVSAAGTTPGGTAQAAQTQTFTAYACTTPTCVPGSGSDVTRYVGPFTWHLSEAGIGVFDTTNETCAYTASGETCSNSFVCNTCIITANVSGVTNVFATAGGVSNLPCLPGSSDCATFTTCPVESISLYTGTNSTGTTGANAGAQVTLSTTVTDSKGIELSSVAPAYYSSQPAIVSPGTTSSTVVPGTANIVASCSPPACNYGLYPVFSNPYLIGVSGTSSTNVYVTSSSPAPSGSSSYLVSYATSNNAAGPALSLPNTPNSMMANPLGSNLILGSNNPGNVSVASPGVMVYSIAGNSVTTTGFWGTVLAVSPDGSAAIIFDPDPLGSPPAPTLYFYQFSNNTASSFSLSNVTRAAFSPDSQRAYVIGRNPSTGQSFLVAVTKETTPVTYSLGNVPVEDINFLTQGSFALLAGGSSTPGINIYATCNNQRQTSSPVATPGYPDFVQSVPNANGAPTAGEPWSTQIVASDSSNAGIDEFTITLPNPVGETTGLSSNPTECVPPHYSAGAASSYNWKSFGIASFQANQLLLTPDSKWAFILPNDHPDLLLLKIGSSGDAAQAPIPLANTCATRHGGRACTGPTQVLGGSSTPDALNVYVTADDGLLHQISYSSSANTWRDTAQVQVNLSGCTSCVPDLVAVVP